MNSTVVDQPLVLKHCPLGKVNVDLKQSDCYVDIWANVDGKIYELGKHLGSKLKNDLASRLHIMHGFDPKNFRLFDVWNLSIQSTKIQYQMLLEALNISRRIHIALTVNFPDDNPIPFAVFNLFAGEIKHDFVFNKTENATQDHIILTLYADNTSHIKQFRQPKHTKDNENKRLKNMLCRLADAQDEYFAHQNGNKVQRVQLMPKLLQSDTKQPE